MYLLLSKCHSRNVSKNYRFKANDPYFSVCREHMLSHVTSLALLRQSISGQKLLKEFPNSVVFVVLKKLLPLENQQQMKFLTETGNLDTLNTNRKHIVEIPNFRPNWIRAVSEITHTSSQLLTWSVPEKEIV